VKVHTGEGDGNILCSPSRRYAVFLDLATGLVQAYDLTVVGAAFKRSKSQRVLFSTTSMRGAVGFARKYYQRRRK
jgi:hypothetical protein